MSSTDEQLIIEQDEGLAILRLNRPDQLNALSSSILRRLETDIPRLLGSPDVRAMMITGTGRAFCAGGDVGTMAGTPNAETTLAGMKRCHAWLKALWCSEKLIITAVNGVAAGGGFGLAMMGDLVVASEAAYFKSAFATLGAAADYGLAFTLPRAVGTSRAADILFSDRRVGAQEALDIGLIACQFAQESFVADALRYARAMASSSRGVQLTKRLLRADQQGTFERYLEIEAQTQTEAFQSQDFLEGVSAFKDRRAPIFRGC